MLKPKKSLGQHFLTDLLIAEDIAKTSPGFIPDAVIEVGPGQGVLTRFLFNVYGDKLCLIEKDKRCMSILKSSFSCLEIKNVDFLNLSWDKIKGNKLFLVGNFPYNISSQIVFKAMEEKDRVRCVVGMFQKELAERLAAAPGSKKYGVISVFLQAYYNVEILFDVSPDKFAPPPKVWSSVIRAERTNTQSLACDENTFKKVVKGAFSQRRKKLSNSIRSFFELIPADMPFKDMRAEQLSVDDFVSLTQWIEKQAN